MVFMSQELERPEKINEQTDQERFEFGTQLANIAMGVSEHADVSIALQTRRRYMLERPNVEVGITSHGYLGGGVDFWHSESFSKITRDRMPDTSLARRVPGSGEGFRTQVNDDILTDTDGNMTRRRTLLKIKGQDVLSSEIVRERPATEQTILAMARLAAIQAKGIE